MKTLIIYESQTGSTKTYAEDIGKAVLGEVIPLKKFKKKMIADYDVLVFGGWVRGSEIQGLNKFLGYWDLMEGKDVIVFSSGMSIPTKEGREALIDANLLYMYHLRFYQLQGNFDYSKLGWKHKLMLDMSLNSIARDPSASADQKALLNLKTTPITYYDSAKVSKIISVINSLSVEKAA